MLGMKNYTQKYIDECRSKVDVGLFAYEKLVAAAKVILRVLKRLKLLKLHSSTTWFSCLITSLFID